MSSELRGFAGWLSETAYNNVDEGTRAIYTALEVRDSELTDLRRQLAEAHRALESLTPGGSEFVGDPERCARNIREQLDFAVRLKERAMERAREAESKLTEARERSRVLAQEILKVNDGNTPLKFGLRWHQCVSAARAIMAEEGEPDADA